jgi:dTDP-4-dehydrorhamnose reductase
MRVLITGANGQLGWEMKKQSPLFDQEIYALGKTSLDITDRKQLKESIEVYNPDIIVNTAAYTAVDLAEKHQDEAYKVNYLAVKNLANICKEKSILLIHLSTDYVFDGLKGRPYIEEDEPKPINTYGLSKIRGEDAVRTILPQHIILRTSRVFGIHGGHNFIKTILNLAKTQDHIKVVDDQFGCPTSARSIAECIYILCNRYSRSEKMVYGTFHFVNSPSTSWYLFAKDVIELAYQNKIIKEPRGIEAISYKNYEAIAKRPLDSSMSTEKIRNSYDIPSLGWSKELENSMSNLLL